MIRTKVNNELKEVRKIFIKKDNVVEQIKKIYKTQKRLPTEYQEVEYIEGTGTQYIDTGVAFTEDNFELITKYALSAVQQSRLIQGNDKFCEASWFQASASDLYWNTPFGDTSGIKSTANQILSESALFSGGKLTWTVDKEDGNRIIKEYQSIGTYTSSNSLYLFSSRKVNSPVKMKLYYHKIKVGNEYVRDMVPCFRKSDNEVGMYDLVNKVFYTNTGTGTFLKGGDVNVVKIFGSLPEEYQEVEYIKSTGTQYIDTGIGVGTNDVVECTWENVFQNGNIVKGSTENKGWGGNLSNSGVNFYGFNGGGREHTGYISFWLGVHFDTTIRSADTEGKKYTDKLTVDGSTTYIKMFENNTIVYDAVYNRGTFSNPRSVYLFKDNSNDPYPGVKKIYKYKHAKNGILVRNLVPCYRKSDNVIGMYDFVSGAFLTNQGTGIFTKGNNIN